jgi:DnaK suppressor protein
MFVSLLQLMGFPAAKPVHSRAEETRSDGASKPVTATAAPSDDGQDPPAGRPTVKSKSSKKVTVKKDAGKAASKPKKSAASDVTAKATAPKKSAKAAEKAVAKASKPLKPITKTLAKSVAKPVAKSAAPAAAKAPVKAPSKAPVATKPSGKVAEKPVPSTPSKTAAKSVAKAPAKAPAKVPPKASVKAVVKPAVKPVAKAALQAPAKAPSKVAAKPPLKAPIKIIASEPKAKAAAPASVQKPAAKAAPPAPVAAPVVRTAPAAAQPAPVPAKAGRPSSRLAQLTVPSMAQSVASTAAKASYNQTESTPVIVPVIPAIVKKDPKLANNWKTKPAAELSDAEVLAMPDAEYMNEVQMAFFRLKLTTLKRDILANAGETTEHLREDSSVVPDPADRATIEEEHALELRTRDRERKLLKKIEQSISRIDAGDYGYCDETGEAIGVGRLLARPTATLSLEAQQRRELKQKMFGD